MAKKETGQEEPETREGADPPTAEEAATRPGKAEEEGGEEGGGDAEGQADPGMDQGGETPATGKAGLTDKEKAFLKAVVDAVRQVFANHDVESVWLTADGLGFGNEADASDHAASLESKALIKIDRKDLTD
ncbi:MAG: hypothetical protein IJ057_10405 [Bacteroidales bacterium]|nr:hypothetical protein [Bacteroidales bacterium]